MKIIVKSEILAQKMRAVLPYIIDEINVAEANVSSDLDKYIEYTCLPNLQILGKKLGKQMASVKKEINELTPE